MLIYVYFNLNKEFFPIDVDPSDSIENVTQKIQDITTILPNNTELFCNGVALTNLSNTLSDYLIEKKFTIIFERPLNSTIKNEQKNIALIVVLSSLLLFSIGYNIKR